jgi:2-polyprenyl-3-methyl-5-hydroxy-6-metoxy-1,4-benzoquinol methylase
MDENYYRTFYDVESRHWWFTARREIILSVAGASLRPGARILDVGCGTGSFLEKARKRYAVAGIDDSPLAVSFCRERGLENIHEGAAADLKQVAGVRYDGIFLLDVIEHIDDPGAALREAGALLAEDGTLFVTVPAFMFLWSEHDENNHHKTRYTAPRLRTLLEQNGFNLIKLSYFNSLLFPAMVAIRMLQRLLRLKSTGIALSPDTGPLNGAMRWLFSREAPWLRRHNFPAGMSIIAVARKAPTAAA